MMAFLHPTPNMLLLYQQSDENCCILVLGKRDQTSIAKA